jgi:alkylation response protein AidB-like acyl-CoA dehydrogenase
MDLTWSAAEDEFRDEARGWLRANAPRNLPSGDTRDGFARHLEWERLLFENRWAVVSWPEEYSGRDASLWEWLIFEEEYYRAGGPQRVTQNGIFLLAPTVFEFGTQDQQDRILPRMAAAEELWCQGWSEPNAGSDLAGIQSRATKVDGGWLLDGQKTWTTRGAFCTHLFGLFRSDATSERHKGLTYFLVPLDSDGVTVRGFGRLDGDTLRSPGRFLATTSRLLQLDRALHAPRDGAVRQRLVDAWMRAEAYQLFTLDTVTRLSEGGAVGAESSINKIWWSELDVDLHELALDLLGPEAQLEGPWSKGYQFSLSGPIYAGTNEIQRNIAAERLLGLPRA